MANYFKTHDFDTTKNNNKRKTTVMRDAVSADKRISVRLSWLATGNNYEAFKFSAAVSPQLLGRIRLETCIATYEELASHYMKLMETLVSMQIITHYLLLG